MRIFGYAVHLDASGTPRCGQALPFALTGDETEVTCTRCLAILTGTYGVGWRKADPRPCGTPAAYRRHHRNGERPCESCRQAESRRRQDYRRTA